MVDKVFCQSCGIPIQESEGLFGTNADGSKMKTIASIALKTGLLLPTSQ